MPFSEFGPFKEMFRPEDGSAPGYLDLLWLATPTVSQVIDKIDRALSAGDPRLHVDALFSDPNWRPHLVGAVALLLDDGARLGTTALWRAIDAGSWVVP